VIRALAATVVLAAAVAAPAAATAARPTLIPLPKGFQPEGIAIRGGPFAYLGSLADGDIYRANVLTGRGRVIAKGPGTPSVGLALDRRNRLWVAGGPTGGARVVNVRSGRTLATYSFAEAPTFVNDVVIARGRAWFTDSMQAALYGVPLDGPGGFVRLPLTGDFQMQEGFNLNGIERTPDGRGLLVVQTNTGRLFRVDPADGTTKRVDLGTATVANGDGLRLVGRTLYVVRNEDNEVAVVTLDRRATKGAVVRTITDSRFDVPTTAAFFGGRLYLPNARFGTEATPDTTYAVVAIRR
jgi:sugar lactone lactonase YvrE